jgi:hypothetical protein
MSAAEPMAMSPVTTLYLDCVSITVCVTGMPDSYGLRRSPVGVCGLDYPFNLNLRL